MTLKKNFIILYLYIYIYIYEILSTTIYISKMLSEIMQILAFCKKIFVISILTFNNQIINIIVEKKYYLYHIITIAIALF